MQRKIIQVAVMPEGPNNGTHLVALCDDGCVFTLGNSKTSVWQEVPPIPQKPVERSFIGQQKD